MSVIKFAQKYSRQNKFEIAHSISILYDGSCEKFDLTVQNPYNATQRRQLASSLIA